MLLIAAMSSSLTACVVERHPRRHAVVEVNVRPPAPRVVVVPAPRVGYAWAPGYWRWNGAQWSALGNGLSADAWGDRRVHTLHVHDDGSGAGSALPSLARSRRSKKAATARPSSG